MQGYMKKHQLQSESGKNKGRAWSRAFITIVVGNCQVRTFSIGQGMKFKRWGLWLEDL